jgi:GNAT superfamily N-acetyltransferase
MALAVRRLHAGGGLSASRSYAGDPRNELHVLHVDGKPAGFAELNRRQPDEIELVQFGLMPEFIGQGLGKWFMQTP